jgi:hypothetical protein
MVPGEVAGIAAHRDGAADLHVLQATCANPRCDEQFMRGVGPGRRKDFHGEDCRRNAERDYRRLAGLLEHYERQAEQIRARVASYVRTNTDDMIVEVNGPSPAQLERARVAIAEVRGMARFLPKHQSEFAQDLLNLFEAVEPLVRSATR